MERVFLAPAMSLDFFLFLGSKIGQNLLCGAPLLEFHLPIYDYSGGHDDEVRTPHTLITGKRCQHRNGLDGLSQSHFICQDTVQLFVMKCHKPV